MAWEGIDPSSWAMQTKERFMAVFRGSVQELSKEMSKTLPNGGNVPVKTGNLARSILAQKGSPPTIKEGPFPGQDIGPVLLTLEPGDTVYLGYQAKYSHRVNYGFTGEDSLGRHYNQAGYGFLEKAVAKWPAIVTKTVINMRQKGGFSSTTIARQMKGS